MKKVMLMLGLMSVLIMSTGCTQPVPVGNVGKIVSPAGVQKGLYGVGRPFVAWRDKLVLVETASQYRPANVSVIMADRVMSKDGSVTTRIGLTMDFIINIRYRINASEPAVNAILSDMRLDGVSTIHAQQVYTKYGDMVVGRASREVLGQYTPEEVLNNLEEINKKLFNKVSEGLQNSPLIVSEVSMGPIRLPDVISKRINKNKEVELSESEKRADQKIAMLGKNNDKALAKEQAAIDLIDAKSLSAQNAVLRSSITPEVLELRKMEIQKLQLEVLKEFANNNNTSTVVLPYEALGSTGAQMKMFK